MRAIYLPRLSALCAVDVMIMALHSGDTIAMSEAEI
jgi:hypothetical protein